MIAIDLIPATAHLARARRRRLRRWAASVCTGLATLGVISLWQWASRTEAQRLHTATLQLAEELSQARSHLNDVTTEAQHLLLQVERAKALRSKRAWSGLLGLVASCLPPGTWLNMLATDPPAPGRAASTTASLGTAGATDPTRLSTEDAAAAVNIDAPRRVRIGGFASEPGAPHELVAKLKETLVFTNVALERSHREQTQDGAYFRFELVCEW